ncbi:hypothetical protein [Streptacidiphilus monticola]|jgi:hypothetical protein|uniref:Uncharacterized protein n=1 Tax=Streptacidiphilus monticola TaxID=2161674 RepID=A0ABW1FXU8_9ACTN
MATVVTVTGASREEVERLAVGLREQLGLRPLGSGRPFEQPGRGGTWMLRLAVPEADEPRYAAPVGRVVT